MSLIKTIAVLAITSTSLWAVNTYAPVTPALKAIINTVLIVLLCLWMLQTFGDIDWIRGIRVS